MAEVKVIKLPIKEKLKKSLVVTATTYTIKNRSTIDFYTKSGFKITKTNPKLDRVIAVSHDLKKLFNYGDSVLIQGIGKHSGVYYIRDLMDSKWKNRIDILLNPNDLLITYYKVKIILMNKKEVQ